MKIAEDLKRTLADPIRITQVMQNLVLDGIQAMPTGGYMDVEARNTEVRLGQSSSLRPGMYVEITGAPTAAAALPRKSAPFVPGKLHDESGWQRHRPDHLQALR